MAYTLTGHTIDIGGMEIPLIKESPFSHDLNVGDKVSVLVEGLDTTEGVIVELVIHGYLIKPDRPWTSNYKTRRVRFFYRDEVVEHGITPTVA